MCRKNSETPDDDGKLSSFILLTLYLFTANYLSFFCLCSVDRLSLGGSRRLRNIEKARDSELLKTFVSFFYSCKRNSLCVQLNRTWFHNEWVDFDFFYLVVHHGIALKPVELIKGDWVSNLNPISYVQLLIMKISMQLFCPYNHVMCLF